LDAIILRGVKTHNLKNIDLVLPHKKLYVITGVSGSGKSSLAFDTLYAEGQRRYVESLSAYARQFLERMEKPDAESVSGIPPALAIEAKNVVSNARSTVGTQTEINDYLRVLFSRIGRTVCPTCNIEVVPNHPDTVSDLLLKQAAGKEALVLFKVPLSKKGEKYLKEFLPELERQGYVDFFLENKKVSSEEILKSKKTQDEISVCVDQIRIEAKNRKRLIDSLEQAFRSGRTEAQVFVKEENKYLEFSEALRCFSCGKTFREPSPNLFSFNSPLGACSVCQGFGRVITIDWNLVIPDVRKSVSEGVIEPWTKPSAEWEAKQLLKFCERKKIPTAKPWKDLSEAHKDLILNGDRAKDQEWREGNYFSVQDYFDYLETKTYKMHIRIFLSKYRGFVPCEACHETRLKPEALWVKVEEKNVFELQIMSLSDLFKFLEVIKLRETDKERVEPVYLEIKRRVRFLNEVGLGYLSLARLSRTLSGGEVQRIHLATSLGSALVDTLYVLDEPSIGLHERDNRLLIRLLHELRDLGNTVVVVEHDQTMIEAADEVIDIGPLGGEKGGKVLFQGTIEGLRESSSLTGEYLSRKREVQRRNQGQKKTNQWIKIQEARQHNLKSVNFEFPLNQMVVLAGVSGSGKSTLLYDILYHHFLRFRGRPVQDLGKVRAISGFEHVDEMILVDQSPIGRTPRSNPATYIKAFDDIRKIFARTPQARREGFEAGHFSFNVDGGRCPDCKGDGRIKVEMHFLADVFIPCEACQGKRFKPEVLEIQYRGKNVDDVLAMTIDDAVDFFAEEKSLVQKLSLLQKVGLGYLRLGQSATTLSGGEAQRMKLACEMCQRTAQHILYLFDEPTTGLHYHDIHFLMEAFEELLARGHSLVIIEHNMEIIRSADYIVDLGPEGGELGGKVLYSGPLQGLSKVKESYTGQYLKIYSDRIKKVPSLSV
jgi:excinuclease ABC subunit A